MKHTPGPWKLLTEGEDNDFTTRTIIIDGPPRNLSEVCIVTTGSFTDETEEANAKLIAAAPDLLAALHAVRRHGLEEGDGYESILKLIGDAINKAEQP
jgi:hypothetical protein